MNAPSRPDVTPRLEDFPYRLSDNVRFADLDPNQHVNNAVYATYFETGRVTLMKDRRLWADAGRRLAGSWFGSTCISAPNCAGRAPSKWGLASSKFGRTSVTFDQVVFSKANAWLRRGRSSVLIDEASANRRR